MNKIKENASPKITLTLDEYEVLKKKAQLVERVLKFVSEMALPIELYSQNRVKEFTLQDRISRG